MSHASTRVVACGLTLLLISPIHADIVATGFFSGTLERFDAATGQQSTFSTIASGDDPFPGLSGIVFDRSRQLLYATARFSDRLYRIDATNGAVLGFQQLDEGSSPAGVAVGPSGNVYIAKNGQNRVSVRDPSGSEIRSIELPRILPGGVDNFPGGVAFDRQGRLVVSTFGGAGLFRYDPSSDSVSPLAAAATANNQIAADGGGDLFVGGAAFTNDVLRFREDGTPVDPPFLTIDESLLPKPENPDIASPDFTSPSGVAFDDDGNLIVAALGRTNPTSDADHFQSNGGLWIISPDGTVRTLGTGLTPLSSVTAIPEPGFALLLCLIALGLCVRHWRRPSGTLRFVSTKGAGSGG